jgi:hypothetical protein
MCQRPVCPLRDHSERRGPSVSSATRVTLGNRGTHLAGRRGMEDEAGGPSHQRFSPLVSADHFSSPFSAR